MQTLLDDSLISTVNLAEVIQKSAEQRADAPALAAVISRMGVHSVPFDSGMALLSAAIWPATRRRGLSLADRACLALAIQMNGIAVTADRAWAEVDVPDLTVHLLKRGLG